MKSFTRSLKCLLPVVALATTGIASAAPSAQAPLKIGFVYVGPIGDAGWTYRHNVAREALEAHFGDKIETTYVESVAEGADSERVLRRLAAKGNSLIFSTSFGFMNPTIKIAKQFPKVKFEHATGYKLAANVGNYASRSYEGRYLAGLIAGKMTKSNILGYVAAFPIPEVVRNINAYTIGAREVNPDVKVQVIWVSSWYAPAKEREAAEALMLKGADVLTHHTDSPAVVQAAEAKGKYAIGFHSNMANFGKHAQLTAVQHNWNKFYQDTVQQVLDGKWQSSHVWGGLDSGMIELTPLNPLIPADVVQLVAAKTAQLKDHSFKIFQGPLNDNSGKQRIDAKQALGDAELLQQKWFVEGVIAK